MIKRRSSPRLENLEPRRVMDAGSIDCPETVDVAAVTSDPSDFDDVGALPEDIDVTDSLRQTINGSGYERLYQTPDSVGVQTNSQWIAFPSSRIFRAESMVIAIAPSSHDGMQKLWAIREGGESGGEIAFTYDLGRLRVEHVLIDGDRLLIIGNQGTGFFYRPALTVDSNNATIPLVDILNDPDSQSGSKVIALDLKSGDVVKELLLPSDQVKHAAFSEGDVTIVAQRNDIAVIAIWPPVETNDTVYRFKWNDDGVSDINESEIPSGHVTVIGHTIVVATRQYEFPVGEPKRPETRTSLKFFALTPTGIVSRGVLNIGNEDFLRVQANGADDRLALVSQSVDYAPTGALLSSTITVEMLDITGDQPVVNDTVTVTQIIDAVADKNVDDESGGFERGDALPLHWHQPQQILGEQDGYLIVQDPNLHRLTIVDLSADRSGPERLKTVELPEHTRLGYSSIRLDDNRLVFLTEVSHWFIPMMSIGPSGLSLPYPYFGSNALLTLSLSDGKVRMQDLGDNSHISRLVEIDAVSSRYGVELNDFDSSVRRFVYGRFDENGQFIADGEVPTDSYAETYHPFTESLIVATAGGFTAYGYDDANDPLYTIRFTDDDAPSLQANDDAIRLYSATTETPSTIQSDWIDLLTNDQIPFFSQFRTEIVELIDAPEGVNLVGGRYIWLDSRIPSLEEPIVFKYRVSDGIDESIAEARISFAAVTSEQRQAMIDAIISSVSQTFGIAADDLTIEGIVSLENSPPNGPDGRPVNSVTQRPWFTFRVTGPRFEAIYGSDLEANVFVLSVNEDTSDNPSKDQVLELSLTAVDDDGNAIDSIKVGESFWLEFVGSDIRRFSKGIFSAFLDLRLSEALKFEGIVEPGNGFTFIDGDRVADRVKEQSISSLGVLDSDGILPEQADITKQTMIRMRVTATAGGSVQLSPLLTQSSSEEALLFGETRALSSQRIKVVPLSLTIEDTSPQEPPTDVDGDGNVEASDALRVINMVSRHGVGKLDEIRARMNANSNASAITELGRFDVNRDGSITPLDALLVINHLSRENRRLSSGSVARNVDNAIADDFVIDIAADDSVTKRRRR